MYVFLAGGAGTGKTFTLNVLKEQISRCYGGEESSVKVAALTGVAARLVKGRTLHSLLKLPVQKDGKLLQLPLLSGIYLRQMRLMWCATKFIIIDEISMVPYEMLVMIDSRLKQLMDNNDIFGGVNVLLFGDLMQLPPVRGNPVFLQPARMEPATHLWQTLSFCELKLNMRQRGDTTFIDILNALRIGELTAEHLKILLEKIGGLTGEFSVGNALRIDPTNKLVQTHNNEALQFHKNQNKQMRTIIAQDNIMNTTKNLDKNDIETLIPTDINKTGGLPKELTIFVGAKVMLRYNVDTQKGLVNGAMGEIEEIIWPNYRRDQIYQQDIPKVCNFSSQLKIILNISIYFI
jgi:ATP-dependent DNA helicase PIF1